MFRTFGQCAFTARGGVRSTNRLNDVVLVRNSTRIHNYDTDTTQWIVTMLRRGRSWSTVATRISILPVGGDLQPQLTVVGWAHSPTLAQPLVCITLHRIVVIVVPDRTQT